MEVSKKIGSFAAKIRNTTSAAPGKTKSLVKDITKNLRDGYAETVKK